MSHLLMMLRRTFLLLLVFCAVSTSFSQAQYFKREPLTALIGAFSSEVKLLEESLTKAEVDTLMGVRIVRGLLYGRPVIVALTGIGKVNAAMTTTLILQHYRPERVIFTGIAGGLNPSLRPGDIVIGQETTHHDFGYVTFQKQQTRQTRNPLTGEYNPVYFRGDSLLTQLALRASKALQFRSIPGETTPPTIRLGRIVTGDVFVSSEEKVRQLLADFEADATEMEGAAVAQICHQLRVPCLVIRSLSDRANSSAREDMLSFLDTAAYNSAALVKQILQLL